MPKPNTIDADACVASLARMGAAGIPDALRENGGSAFPCDDGRTVSVATAGPDRYRLSVYDDSGPIAAWNLDGKRLVRRTGDGMTKEQQRHDAGGLRVLDDAEEAEALAERKRIEEAERRRLAERGPPESDEARRARRGLPPVVPPAKPDKKKAEWEKLSEDIRTLEGTIEHDKEELDAHRKQITHSQAEVKRYTGKLKTAERELKAKKAKLKKLL